MTVASRRSRGFVWRTRAMPSCPSETDWAWLSPRDQARAAAISHPAARTRFVVGRALLRATMSELDPARVRGPRDGRTYELEAAPSGRLRVVDDPGLQVSVSHTRGLAAVAVSRVGDIGIDVEPLARDDLPPTHAWLTAGEEQRLADLTPAARRRSLLRLWVAKEAAIKAGDRRRPVTRRTIEVDEDRGAVLGVEGAGTAERDAVVASLRWCATDRFVVAVAIATPPPAPPGRLPAFARQQLIADRARTVVAAGDRGGSGSYPSPR
jgi:phosphopantetheinyl transferase